MIVIVLIYRSPLYIVGNNIRRISFPNVIYTINFKIERIVLFYFFLDL